MGTMSDSQFEFEDKYDDDFFDDVSADENNQDSGMEEKVVIRNSFDTDTDNETDKSSLHTPTLKPKKNNTKVIGKDKKTPVRNSDPYKSSYMTPTNRRAQSDPRGRRAKKSDNKGSAPKPGVNNNVAPNAVIKRVLSASRKKTSALHNVIYELQQQVEELTIANRDLKRSSRVQERDLRKLDGAEAQLPILMKKHSNEINVLQEKYKRQKEIALSLTDNIKKVDHELLKTKDKLKEYQVMAEEKNLPERIELKNNVLNLEGVIEEKDNKISELNRSLAIQKKTHARIIKEKNVQYEKAKEHVKELEEVQKDLVQRLKNREKALEVTNIYSRRAAAKEGKQVVMFSPNDPIAPILKKCQEESLEILDNLTGGKSRASDTSDMRASDMIASDTSEDFSSRSDSRGDRIDTMVSRNSVAPEISSNMSSPRAEEVGTTFMTEGKLKRQDSEDFFGVNNGKQIVPVTTKGKKIDTMMEGDSLGEDELHDKLDQMIAKRKVKEDAADSIPEVNDTPDVTIKEKSFERVQEELVNPVGTVGKTDIVAGQRRNHEQEEEARKRKLLLARIQAIDNGEDPSNVTTASVDSTKRNEKKSKHKKPIFLESPKSSAPNSDDDLASIKSIDEYSNDNSISNSANTRSRRNRPFTDTYSGSEPNSAEKSRPRRDSWEFKITDENLHKGLPAFSGDTHSPKRTQVSQKRNNDRSLTGPLGNSNNNIVNGAKNDATPNKSEWGNNTYGGVNYSPTGALDNGQNRKTSKKNTFDLFDQFDDPFKSLNKNKTKPENSFQESPDKNLFESGKRTAKSNKAETPVVDDLEEMFIL